MVLLKIQHYSPGQEIPHFLWNTVSIATLTKVHHYTLSFVN